MAKAANKANSTVKNAMDYPEHERTYDIFLWISKWTIAFCIALLIGMMVMFPMKLGFIAGTLTFIILMVVSFFAIQR